MPSPKPTAMPDLKVRKQITARALVTEIAVGANWIHCATLAPDGRQLLLGTGGAIIVVDLVERSSNSVVIEAAHYHAVSKIRFTADGERIVTTHWNGSVGVLEWPSLRPIAVHAVTTDRLHALAVLPDGNSAWVGGHDCKRSRIDLATGKVIASIAGEWGWVSDAALSPDGKTLITGAAAARIRLCDGTTGVERKQFQLDIAHNIIVDGDQALVPCLYTATVDLATGEVVQKLDGEHKLGASGAVLVDGGKVIVTVGQHDPLMALWDCVTGRPLLTMKPLKKAGFAAVVVVGESLVTVPLYEAPLQVWRTAALVDAGRGNATAREV